MSKLTLQDYQSKTINDLFMAVIVKRMSFVEWLKSNDSQDEGYEIDKNLENIVNRAVKEAIKDGEFDPAVEKYIPDFMKRINDMSIISMINPIIMLKNEDTCINVMEDEEIDMATHELIKLEPFSNYYSEGEYRFVERKGRIFLDLDSMEPFEKYQRKTIIK